MINLSEPYDHAVYQRDNQNRAKIPVVGTGAKAGGTVTVTLTPAIGGTATSAVFVADANGNYSGGLVADGGWYNLTATDGTDPVTRKVGAGEVLVCWGHSFMQSTNGPAGSNERVVTLTDLIDETNYQFGTLTNMVGPFLTGGAGPWAVFGDKLVNRLNVPVLLYNTAFGGSNIEQNWKVLKGIPFTHGFIDYNKRMPYHPLEKVMGDYIPKTGIRAILAEHGYNDAAVNPASFTEELNFVIDYTRNQFGVPDLAIVMVQEETSGRTDRLGSAAIAQALANFIATKPNLWQGPDFNGAEWNAPELHQETAHLTNAGNLLFASEWDASLTNAFFSGSTPYLSRVDVATPISGTDTNDIQYAIEPAPTPANGTINYIIYGLAALLALGLLTGRYRAKSILGLLILAGVYVYRLRQ
ncbi:sialate O-acetylesterase [Spirosoma litoris]